MLSTKILYKALPSVGIYKTQSYADKQILGSNKAMASLGNSPMSRRVLGSACTPNATPVSLGNKFQFDSTNASTLYCTKIHNSGFLLLSQVTCNDWASAIPILAKTGIQHRADIANPERHCWPNAHPVIRMHSGAALATLRAGIVLMLVCRNQIATRNGRVMAQYWISTSKYCHEAGRKWPTAGLVMAQYRSWT